MRIFLWPLFHKEFCHSVSSSTPQCPQPVSNFPLSIAEQFSPFPNVLLQTHRGAHRAEVSSLLTLRFSERSQDSRQQTSYFQDLPQLSSGFRGGTFLGSYS